jgi:hypothetical protein
MNQFKSLHWHCKLSPAEIAELIELFVAAKLDIWDLADRFGIGTRAVDRYIYTHYYGFVEKANQTTIKIKSKV